MFLPIIIIGGKEIAHLAAQYPQYVDQVKDYIMNSPVVQEFANSGGLIESLTSISKGGLYLFVAMIFTYFSIVDRDKILNAIVRFFPKNSRSRMTEIWNISEQKLSRFVSSQFIASASVGLIILVGLLILRVDSAVILGCISAVLDIVPIVGPPVVVLTAGTSLLCSVPNWIRLAKITKESKRYTNALPENYELKPKADMRILVLK